MQAIIGGRANDLKLVCDQFGVKRLDLFGSGATDKFHPPPSSGLDFLVEFFSIPA